MHTGSRPALKNALIGRLAPPGCIHALSARPTAWSLSEMARLPWGDVYAGNASLVPWLYRRHHLHCLALRWKPGMQDGVGFRERYRTAYGKHSGPLKPLAG